jgi:uncharacterized membrane protein YkvI
MLAQHHAARPPARQPASSRPWSLAAVVFIAVAIFVAVAVLVPLLAVPADQPAPTSAALCTPAFVPFRQT